MQNLIIIGAGGMGRTMYDLARESIGYGSKFEVVGFIDDNLDALADFKNYPPILGTIAKQKMFLFVPLVVVLERHVLNSWW